MSQNWFSAQKGDMDANLYKLCFKIFWIIKEGSNLIGIFLVMPALILSFRYFLNSTQNSICITKVFLTMFYVVLTYGYSKTSCSSLTFHKDYRIIVLSGSYWYGYANFV